MSTATIALLGQPNSGKSTLFNALTGLRQHVGNWPGKTVEKKEGTFTHGSDTYSVADLPGSYSMSANSDEEVITRDFIASGKADVVCILADSSQLERSLFMLADYAGLSAPCFLVLNMEDVAKEQGKTIDAAAIEKKLGIPVMLFSATDIKAYDKFYATLERALKTKAHINVSALEKEYEKLGGYSEIKSQLSENTLSGYTPMWLTVKVLENDKVVSAKLKDSLPGDKFGRIESLAKNGADAVATGECKFAWIDDILHGAVSGRKNITTLGRLDRIYTHRIWGKPAVVLTVILGLLGSFIPALPVMAVGSLVTVLQNAVGSGLTSAGYPHIIISLLCDVILQSMGYVIKMLGFVFGVTLVFGMLEEVGVMARISYVFDNTMGKLGLQGKSVMPFLVSFGCTMGGASGARVIDNWGQKVLTIALAWAVPCGAAWAIIPMLSTVFFGAGAPLIIVALLLTMLLHMWVTAKIFGRTLVKTEDRCGMIMELPPYHKPRWGALFKYVLGRTKDTFFRVVKVVLLVCGIFWVLSYGGSNESSILYKVGTAIEPVTGFFGMPWQLFIAFVASSVGKEGAVGVISALYSGSSYSEGFMQAMSGAARAANLNELLLANVTLPEALAFIFALTFNLPCVVALAATYQEIRSVKWTAKIALYYTATALVLACVAYHVGLLIW
ncbi:ferrous iron transport protein B [Ruminococcus sp. YE71]|uniref:ferrous iron transport protein B n=1 Tax=unclassified Ruminococcus TaxID=2608920 RepID=UPI00088756EE|nr:MULTISPECIES: ferrous iron transport protein B [unclassified Ruminococcus]SDA23623.1 ferrous iron transport protein B [Ruminococcus sp. YE78]SFW40169.1 ferrous iron transport protein B [Ruminococcus sp. YE71]